MLRNEITALFVETAELTQRFKTYGCCSGFIGSEHDRYESKAMEIARTAAKQSNDIRLYEYLSGDWENAEIFEYARFEMGDTYGHDVLVHHDKTMNMSKIVKRTKICTCKNEYCEHNERGQLVYEETSFPPSPPTTSPTTTNPAMIDVETIVKPIHEFRHMLMLVRKYLYSI